MDKHIEELDRQEFETWFISIFHPKHMNRDKYGNYQFIDANIAFIVWKERGKALLAKLEAAQKEISEWRSIAEAAAQDDADWHKLTDSKNEVISQLAQGIIQLKESAEQNAKALNRVAHQRDKAFADIEAAEARLLVPVKLPDGWRLAPIKPTKAMIDAFKMAYEKDESYAEHWIRMLAAAPNYPVEGGE